MDVWGITLATLRRWYVFLPVLAVSVLLVLAAGQRASPEYEATGSIMLTPARTTSPIANPFVNAAGASEAITIILNGPETREKLTRTGRNGTVTVTSASRSSIVTMRSVSPDPESAVALIDTIIDIASEQLAERQRSAGLERESSIGLQVLAAPSITAVASDTALRVQAVILVLGLTVGVTFSVLFDDILGLIRRRRKGRRQRVMNESIAPLDADAALPSSASEDTLPEQAGDEGARREEATSMPEAEMAAEAHLVMSDEFKEAEGPTESTSPRRARSRGVSLK